MRTRVKICGFTTIDEAVYAAHLGVDAIGLVFYAKSPRSVEIGQAQTIIQKLSPFVTTVGLFVDAEPSFIQHVLANISLDVLQFHGEETPDYCTNFSKPYIKAIRMRPDTDIKQYVKRYASAQALLLDSYVKGMKGGTGVTFDWQQIPTDLNKPIIVAGGLTIANVTQAITKLQPYAVDVSGGVESAKGIKNAEKMTAFMQGI